MQGVIFDLDGTLLNTIGDLQYALNATFAAYDVAPFSYDDVISYVGNGLRKMVEIALEARDVKEDVDAVLTRFIEAYEGHAMVDTYPYEDVLETLDFFQEQGIPMGICTNKKEDLALQIIEHYFPGISFTQIIGDMAGFERKPSPQGVLEIAKTMNLSPQKILYVGDSIVDVNTAKAGGFPFVGVTYGFEGHQALAEEGTTAFIESPLAIIHRFKPSVYLEEIES